MSNPHDSLTTLRVGFIENASRALASAEGLRHVVEGEVARFFDALLESLAEGNAQGIERLLQSWAESGLSGAPGEKAIDRLTVLNTLRTALLRTAREGLPAECALQAIAEIDPLLAVASVWLVSHELELVRAEVETQLADARMRLERLDKSKSGFISVAAHELKTPLTLIEGYSNMLGMEFPGDQFPRAQLLLGGVANGTRRLREIIDDMIDVSMIDNNLLSLNFQPVWLNRLIEMCQSELQPTVKERSQTLQLRPFHGWDTMTYADPERLYQVFMNIMRNAIKYTPDQGRITVGGRQLPGFIEITFADTGIGIDPANQQLIFEKFAAVGNVALHSSGKSKFKGGGPGLGLPIAKGIIEAHGGTLWCESQGCDDKTFPGTVFHVMIPLRDAPPKDNSPKLFGLTADEMSQIARLDT